MISFTTTWLPSTTKQTLDATYYPCLKMMLVEGRLFNVACPHVEGMCVWDQFLCQPSEAQTGVYFPTVHDYSYLIIATNVHGRGLVVYCMTAWWSMVGGFRCQLSVFLRRIQRAVKGFISARRQAKRLALAMALHPRLGSHSILQCLPADMLVQIY